MKGIRTCKSPKSSVNYLTEKHEVSILIVGVTLHLLTYALFMFTLELLLLPRVPGQKTSFHIQFTLV